MRITAKDVALTLDRLDGEQNGFIERKLLGESLFAKMDVDRDGHVRTHEAAYVLAKLQPGALHHLNVRATQALDAMQNEHYLQAKNNDEKVFPLAVFGGGSAVCGTIVFGLLLSSFIAGLLLGLLAGAVVGAIVYSLLDTQLASRDLKMARFANVVEGANFKAQLKLTEKEIVNVSLTNGLALPK